MDQVDNGTISQLNDTIETIYIICSETIYIICSEEKVDYQYANTYVLLLATINKNVNLRLLRAKPPLSILKKKITMLCFFPIPIIK